jgi:hypothetical protein
MAGKEKDYYVLCRRLENEKTFFQKRFFNFHAAPKSVSETGTRGGQGPHTPVRGRFSFDPPC